MSFMFKKRILLLQVQKYRIREGRINKQDKTTHDIKYNETIAPLTVRTTKDALTNY